MSDVSEVKAMATKTNSRPHVNRTLGNYPAGTTVYNYRFLHPKFGWVGGLDTEDWSNKKETVIALMSHVRWPTELIERVVGE